MIPEDETGITVEIAGFENKGYQWSRVLLKPQPKKNTIQIAAWLELPEYQVKDDDGNLKDAKLRLDYELASDWFDIMDLEKVWNMMNQATEKDIEDAKNEDNWPMPGVLRLIPRS